MIKKWSAHCCTDHNFPKTKQFFMDNISKSGHPASSSDMSKLFFTQSHHLHFYNPESFLISVTKQGDNVDTWFDI
jgi:hypothetical protein